MSASIPGTVRSARDSFYSLDEAVLILGEQLADFPYPVPIINRIDQTMRAHLDGPSPESAALGFTAALPSGSSELLDHVDLTDAHLNVVFADELESISGFGLPGFNRRVLAELGATLFQFGEVESIGFQLVSGCEAFWGSFETESCPTLYRSDFEPAKAE